MSRMLLHALIIAALASIVGCATNASQTPPAARVVDIKAAESRATP